MPTAPENASLSTPHVIVLAGPNGAGKSTSAPRLLKGALHVVEFVNADVIAQGLSAYNSDRVAFEAGEIMLRRLRALADGRSSFAFETTLATRSFAPWLTGLVSNGYQFHLLYHWLDSADTAVARVAQRVQRGGHHVLEETIRRRYSRGLKNFFDLYRPIASKWRMYDNSKKSGPQLIASGRGEVSERIRIKAIWDQICRSYRDDR